MCINIHSLILEQRFAYFLESNSWDLIPPFSDPNWKVAINARGASRPLSTAPRPGKWSASNSRPPQVRTPHLLQ